MYNGGVPKKLIAETSQHKSTNYSENTLWSACNVACDSIYMHVQGNMHATLVMVTARSMHILVQPVVGKNCNIMLQGLHRLLTTIMKGCSDMPQVGVLILT